FQAEDGIRDGHVTGVQTCALPICTPAKPFSGSPESAGVPTTSRSQEPRRCGWMLPSTASLRQTGGRELERIVFDEATIARRVRRSEERRVGKEWRARGWAYQ